MGENLREKLMMKKEKGWLSVNDEEREQIFKFSDELCSRKFKPIE